MCSLTQLTPQSTTTITNTTTDVVEGNDRLTALPHPSVLTRHLRRLKVTPSRRTPTQLGDGACCHLSWCVSHVLSFLQPCLRAIEEFLLPQGFAWNGLVHLIKHYVSTPPYAHPTSPPPSPWKSLRWDSLACFCCCLIQSGW